jgi:hypothetical protein
MSRKDSHVFHSSLKKLRHNAPKSLYMRWSGDGGRSFREIVRQQWNFSPPNTISEVEDYVVDLSDVRVLELIIVPDISRGAARASLRSLRLS